MDGFFHGPLGQDALNHLTMHVRQASLNSIVIEGQAGVVDPEQVEHGCVEIRPCHPLFDRLPSDLIGGSVREAGP